MSQELVLVVIGVIVAAFVLRPLLKGRAKAAPAAPVRDPGPAVASADELAELELDHSMGRVSDDDYARWREQLAESGVAVSDEGGDPVAADARGRAELLVRQFRDTPRPRCATCGERPEPGARFCSSCGSAL
jgi:hypothetical protein